ncbi:MAG TPA: carboxyl transferase domain-containing protein [Acidimicrobiales bacterium]|nr:carboxyl transferase domain-containing protein [Acidimicrobiales bacterium]
MPPTSPLLPIAADHPGSLSAELTTIAGREVVLVGIAGGERRGALTEADGHTFAAAALHALDAGLPLLGVMASSGADVHDGVAALHGWGRAAAALARCSGRVPVLLAATGPVLSGPALLLGLADQVVMTEDAYAFVSGPRMVETYTGERLEAAELGGAGVHAAGTGVATLVVPDHDTALDALSDLLAYLPSAVDEEPPRWWTDDPVDRATPEAGECIPASPTGGYDVRDVAAAIVDHGELLELRARWAPNLVTALATIGGRPVGIVANQPVSIAGTLDIPASQKGARFVAFCDAFGIPLLTLIDTPGFYPGKDLEWRGMIRYGGQLAFAYARATVPRVAVVLRKAYGGAYIVMDCRTMGSDLYLAWPSAEIAVMGAKGAVEILHRRESPERRAELEADYDRRFLNPYVAADRGSVDMVIHPADTRREVAAAFELLSTKQERLVRRKHDNTPL